MALNINGTTGISGVDGSNSSPAIQGTDSNTGLSFASDTVKISTGGTTRATIDSSGALDVPTDFPIKVNGSEKLRIDSSGRVMIGQTSSVLPFLVSGAASNFGGMSSVGVIGDTTAAAQNVGGGLTFSGRYNSSASQVGYASIRGIKENGTDGNYDGTLTLNTRPNGGIVTERMRVASNGNVGINQTNPVNKFQVTVNGFNFQISNTNGRIERSFSGSGSTDDDGMWFIDNDSNTGTYIRFWNTTSGANVIGSITHGTSNTSYNTSSDYRLKENITSISDGITRLKTLKPSRFNFKVDKDTTFDGFIAHEVTAVPEAITGTKDEVAEKDVPEIGLKKGDPVYQGIDQSKLVPLLTAALQEAIAKIEVLVTKVAALEAA